MWLFTNFGFYSIVQKRGDRELTIRSRVKGDLEALSERYLPSLGEITEGGGSDYPFRAKASHAAVAEAMAKAVADIKYHNYKQAVGEMQGRERERVYEKVWSALMKLEQKPSGR